MLHCLNLVLLSFMIKLIMIFSIQKNYEDYKFDVNYLGKLVDNFHTEIKNGRYINNTNEILRIKRIFSDILFKNNIKSNFTSNEKLNMNNLIKKVIYTISKSNDINSNTITKLEYNIKTIL